MAEKAVDKKRKGQRARLLRWISVAAAVLVILSLALFDYFLPFASLRPAAALPARREGELRLHFLDAGQGDCTVVEFPSGRVLVVDAGDGSFESRNKLVSYLKGIDPVSIDFLVTHADSDHYGGYTALYSCFEVRKAYLPVLPGSSGGYLAFVQATEREGCETDVLTRYDAIEEEGVSVVCLSPFSTGEKDENDSSTVLYLEYNGVRAVLCGDISSSRERLLADEYALDSSIFDRPGRSVRLSGVDLLKAAHHGSSSSSSERWLALLAPSALVVTAGRGNAYGHPSGEALSRYRAYVPEGEIYRTDELGDVIAIIHNGTYTVTTVGSKT